MHILVGTYQRDFSFQERLDISINAIEIVLGTFRSLD